MLLSRIAYNWSELPQQIKNAYEKGDIAFADRHILINTPDGNYRADFDDMVVCGVEGALYACRPDTFFTNYRMERTWAIKLT